VRAKAALDQEQVRTRPHAHRHHTLAVDQLQAEKSSTTHLIVIGFENFVTNFQALEDNLCKKEHCKERKELVEQIPKVEANMLVSYSRSVHTHGHEFRQIMLMSMRILDARIGAIKFNRAQRDKSETKVGTRCQGDCSVRIVFGQPQKPRAQPVALWDMVNV